MEEAVVEVAEVRDTDPVPDELRDGGVVIEAGAYEGAWAAKVCEQRPGCQVLAFEPATRAYEVALEKLSGLPNVGLFCIALGKKTGIATLCDRNRDGANTFDHNLEDEPTETVPVVDVAQIVEPLGEIALMHLNAEGGEIDILEHLLDMELVGRVQIFLVQFHTYDDEMRARIARVKARLDQTHVFEHHYAWGWWRLKGTIEKETTCL